MPLHRTIVYVNLKLQHWKLISRYLKHRKPTNKWCSVIHFRWCLQRERFKITILRECPHSYATYKGFLLWLVHFILAWCHINKSKTPGVWFAQRDDAGGRWRRGSLRCFGQGASPQYLGRWMRNVESLAKEWFAFKHGPRNYNTRIELYRYYLYVFFKTIRHIYIYDYMYWIHKFDVLYLCVYKCIYFFERKLLCPFFQISTSNGESSAATFCFNSRKEMQFLSWNASPFFWTIKRSLFPQVSEMWHVETMTTWMS